MDKANNLKEIYCQNDYRRRHDEWKNFYKTMFERCQKRNQSEINSVNSGNITCFFNALKEYVDSNENALIWRENVELDFSHSCALKYSWSGFEIIDKIKLMSKVTMKDYMLSFWINKKIREIFFDTFKMEKSLKTKCYNYTVQDRILISNKNNHWKNFST